MQERESNKCPPFLAEFIYSRDRTLAVFKQPRLAAIALDRHYSSGRLPGSICSLVAVRSGLTFKSFATRIWQDNRRFSAVMPFLARIAASASPIGPASPSIISHMHVVHLAFPPQRCKMSTPLSSNANTSFFPFSASKE
jgi:hypothetical protein